MRLSVLVFDCVVSDHARVYPLPLPIIIICCCCCVTLSTPLALCRYPSATAYVFGWLLPFFSSSLAYFGFMMEAFFTLPIAFMTLPVALWCCCVWHGDGPTALLLCVCAWCSLFFVIARTPMQLWWPPTRSSSPLPAGPFRFLCVTIAGASPRSLSVWEATIPPQRPRC